MESKDNTLRLDTTGEYLQVGGRKPAVARPEQSAETQAEQKLFYDNAFVVWANKERILRDSRMSLAPVPIQSGLAYTGTSGFRNPTLGVYLEFWQGCHFATLMDEDGRKGLVCRIAGSPLSGSNKCGVVYEDGKVENKSLQHFLTIWRTFMEINTRYDKAKSAGEWCFTLQQVVDILKEEGPVDYDSSAMEASYYKKDAAYWKERCLSAEAKCDSLRLNVRRLRLETKREQLTELVKKVDLFQKKIDALTEEIGGQRRMMLEKLHTKEMSASEYQRWWMALPLRKEKDKEKRNLMDLVSGTLKALYPDDYVTFSIREVRNFVETLSSAEEDETFN